MDQPVKKSGFKGGDVVTVVNKKDIMYGHQGEVVRTFIDDQVDYVLLVVVKFHVRVVGHSKELRQDGDYYKGIKNGSGLMVFAYQDKTPEPSSIRLDSSYTEDNKKKIGLS